MLNVRRNQAGPPMAVAVVRGWLSCQGPRPAIAPHESRYHRAVPHGPQPSFVGGCALEDITKTLHHEFDLRGTGLSHLCSNSPTTATTTASTLDVIITAILIVIIMVTITVLMLMLMQLYIQMLLLRSPPLKELGPTVAWTMTTA